MHTKGAGNAACAQNKKRVQSRPSGVVRIDMRRRNLVHDCRFSGCCQIQFRSQLAHSPGGPGAVALENFEGYLAGTPISSLPGLGVAFDPLAGGGQPSTYLHPVDNTGYGRMHLANFTNNNPTAYPRNNDIVLTVASGYLITALGFWNGDGQSSIYRADIYDASNNVTPVDFVQALSPTFAGFISDTAITKVVFLGNSVNGDGWNHLDGLQTNATVVPLPAAAWLLLSALGALGLMRRRATAAIG